MSADPKHFALVDSKPAAADLSALQLTFVKLVAGEYAAVAAITDVPSGVLQNKPLAGQQAEVLRFGETQLLANAAIADGDVIGTSADGQADPIVAGTDTTVYVAGVAMSAVSGADLQFRAFINCTAPGRAA